VKSFQGLWPLSEQQTDWQGNLAEKGLPKEAMVAGFRQKTSGNPPDFYHLLLRPESNYLSPFFILSDFTGNAIHMVLKVILLSGGMDFLKHDFKF
jgi:hypothetical protein